MPEQRCSLGATIRARRIELGWSQEELAERISIDDEYVRQSEISRIESGRVALPRRRRLELLAAALDLPLGQLLASSGWAGADQAFDSQPVLPPIQSTGRVRHRYTRTHFRSTASTRAVVYRRAAAPGRDINQVRELRLERIRETTRQMQTRPDHSGQEIETVRRQ